jgi:hypothetical protein
MAGDDDNGKTSGGDPLEQATIRVRMKRAGDNEKPAVPDFSVPGAPQIPSSGPAQRPGVVVRCTTGPRPEPAMPEGPTERLVERGK